MWVFIWILLSAFIIGVFVWSLYTLGQQKTAWRSFAQKNGLSYRPGRFNESPYVEGPMEGFQVALFADMKLTPDMRGQRYVTVIEIELKRGMPTGGVVATAAMAPYLAELSFSESFAPDYKGWKPEYILRGRNSKALEDYLTVPRLKLLAALFEMKNSNVLYFFDEDNAALRIETMDPMRSAAHVEKMVRQFLSAVPKLLEEEAVASDAGSPALEPDKVVAESAPGQPEKDSEPEKEKP